jgi:hypothetical protein
MNEAIRQKRSESFVLKLSKDFPLLPLLKHNQQRLTGFCLWSRVISRHALAAYLSWFIQEARVRHAELMMTRRMEMTSDAHTPYSVPEISSALCIN